MNVQPSLDGLLARRIQWQLWLHSSCMLSYTKLIHTIFAALSFGILDYPDGTRKLLWLPDATVEYFSGRHIPLFIAAVLILLVGVVYTAVLLS